MAKSRLPRRRTLNLSLFVDESEPNPNRDWLVIGVLIVPSRLRPSTHAALVQVRESEGYRGEVHWSELRRTFDGPYSAVNRVARAWLTWFGNASHTYFTALAVNRPRLKHDKLRDEVLMRNRFTRMAIESALAHLPLAWNTERVRLRILIDDRSRGRTDTGRRDNLEHYLTQELRVNSWHSRGITHVFTRIPARRASDECVFLQLADLLAGACGAVLAGTATRQAKRELADLARAYILGGMIDLWAFPDQNGKPYKPVHP
ncbi:MAG: DUF3800 domain-containing protein [Thermorudis peleae]|nr:DUF3800 domain-containing protein [Thermorudis peleae]